MELECPKNTYYNLSFDSDKAADRETRNALEHVAKIEEHSKYLESKGGEKIPQEIIDNLKERHAMAWRRYWAALGRCASPMITGPARFPVDQMRKRRSSSDKRYQEISDHLEACFKRLKHVSFPHGMPGETVRADDPDALVKLNADVEQMRQNHQKMLTVNKILRTDSRDEALSQIIDLGFSVLEAEKMTSNSRRSRNGFESFQLSNSNARIRAAERRIRVLEASKAKPNKLYTWDDNFRVLLNRETQRIQIFFVGRPDSETITKLKKRAFKWAPSVGAWQRQITNNALSATGDFLTDIGRSVKTANTQES